MIEKKLFTYFTGVHGLFLMGRITQYDRVDNYFRDTQTHLFILNKNIYNKLFLLPKDQYIYVE